MPLTPAQMEAAILMLQNETRRLNTVTQQQAAKIAALEQASPGPFPWDRLLAAVNQFGQFHFQQLANQTLAPKPARPWKEV